jgi:hypothetical protein
MVGATSLISRARRDPSPTRSALRHGYAFCLKKQMTSFSEKSYWFVAVFPGNA